MKRSVVDQSGLRIVMIGIILSLFFGLIFKSQIRSSVVKVRLQQVLTKLQKDINIDFEAVDVRLSEWGIPRPVIEIRGIRISPLKANCQENQIFIDNLSFPLSFNLLFSKEKVISTVRISLLEARTKSSRQCFAYDHTFNKSLNTLNRAVAAETGSSSSSSSLALTEPDPFEKLRHFKSHLNEIKIDRLRILAVDKMNTAVDLNAVQVQFKYDHENLHELLLQGQILAFKESDRSYYLFKSDMRLSVKLEEKPSINADFKGLIVDRPFQLKVKNDLQKNSIQFLGELDAISLKAINYIVKVERPSTEVLDFLSGSSVSGYLTGEYFFADKSYDFDFKDIKIKIGGGIAEINDIYVFGKSEESAQIRPFDLQLSHIELTKILSHSLFDNIRPSIQNAGFISGMIQFIDMKNFKVKSLIENTSFVFSNKGQRVSQIFDSFNFHVNFEPRKISFNINDFILDSQKIKGFVKYNHNTITDEQDLVVDLEGHLLKPDTVTLFTGLAYDPNIKLNLMTDFKNNLKGSARVDKLNIHQFEFDDLKLDYEKNLLLKSEIYNVKASSFTLRETEHGKDNQLNVLFNQLLPKPSVTFLQSKINVQKDGLGKMVFTFNQPIFNLSGEFIPDAQNIAAKGSYKKQNFTLSGNIDNLILVARPL